MTAPRIIDIPTPKPSVNRLTVACFEESVTLDPHASWGEYVAARKRINEMLRRLDLIAQTNACAAAEHAEAIGTLSGMVTA